MYFRYGARPDIPDGTKKCVIHKAACVQDLSYLNAILERVNSNNNNNMVQEGGAKKKGSKGGGKGKKKVEVADDYNEEVVEIQVIMILYFVMKISYYRQFYF